MNKKRILKYIVMFLLLALFFTVVCPIVPYEGDDWYFIGAMRQPIPYANAFNPSKVLPEIIEPLCGYFAAYILKPITGDYVLSLSLAASIFISALITLMTSLFNRFISSRFNLKKSTAFAYEILFLLSFFVIFKVETANSFYGFWSKSYNCYFNYLVPALANACLVLFMLKYEDFSLEFRNISYLKKGLFIVLAYLVIFSSIQLNIITASFVAILLLKKIYLFIKSKKKDFLGLIKDNYIYLIILIMWIIAVIYDLTGNRGKMVSSGSWLNFARFKDTVISLLYLYRLVYKPLIIITILSVGAIVFNAIRNKDFKDIIRLIKIIILIAINTLYIVILYMKAGSGYATRVDATWGILFYLIIFIIETFIICNKCYKITEVIIPIIIVLLSFVAFNFNHPFYQSVFDAKAAKAVDDYIINQIVEADKEGKISVEVKVPKHGESGSNWPQPYNMATWLQNTLYAHKITRNRMYIKFVPDEEVTNELLNKKYDNMFFFDFERSKYLK